MTQSGNFCFLKDTAEKSQQFPECFYLTGDNKLDELIRTAMSLFKSSDVFQSQDGGNDCNGISETKENQIHQQTGNPSVTVYKRMDKDKFLLRQCCQFERMQQDLMLCDASGQLSSM